MLEKLIVVHLLPIELKDAPDSVAKEREHDEDQLESGKDEEISVEAPLIVGSTLEAAHRFAGAARRRVCTLTLNAKSWDVVGNT